MPVAEGVTSRARAAWTDLKRFGSARDASTAIEYVLIASLVAVVIYAGFAAIGLEISDILTEVAGSF